MPNLSELDGKYFVSNTTFNCPFCARRNVVFQPVSHYSFDWTDQKKCFVYFTKCSSCAKTAMHLSYEQLRSYPGASFEDLRNDVDLDSLIFYSVPTSFFVLDERVPRIVRELFTEAEGCLKSNFLTGASACARKLIYELARIEKAKGSNYEERIKGLKEKRPDVEPSFFDTLATIQEVTSDKVHEEAYDGWESKHLRLILATISEVLREMYIVPKLREEKRAQILKLKEEIISKKPPTK